VWVTRVVEHGQRAQRPRDATPLACCTQVEPDAPVEPVRAGERSVHGPAAALVEASDEGEQPLRSRVDVGGDLGDLVRERVGVG
jgi:hypothetical protein